MRLTLLPKTTNEDGNADLEKERKKKGGKKETMAMVMLKYTKHKLL